MKKIIIFFALILTILIFVVYLLTRKTSPVNPVTPQPQIFPTNIQVTVGKLSILPTVTVSLTLTPTSSPRPADFLPNQYIMPTSERKRISEQIKPLNKEEFDQIQQLKTSQPIITDDFEIDYVYFLDQFVVTKKSTQAESRFWDWIEKNKLENFTGNRNLFVIADKSGYEYQKEKSTVIIQASPAEATSENNQFKTIFDILKIIFESSGQNNSSTTPTPSPAIKNINYPAIPTTLAEIFQEAGTKVGVPPKILEAVMRAETPSTFNLSAEKISLYSTPGNSMEKCAESYAGAQGPMQFMPGTWVGYANSINTYGGYTHQPNICNIKDSVYAAAAKLKRDSGATDPLVWTKEQVDRAIVRYGGPACCSMNFAHIGNKTYCQHVWDYYNS